MRLRVLAAFALVACGDDGDDSCERYKAYAALMSRLDPQTWSEVERCPSDAAIAAKGWAETTLAQCVALLEQRCQGVDVDSCNREPRLTDECACEIGLGEVDRATCSPAAINR